MTMRRVHQHRQEVRSSLNAMREALQAGDIKEATLLGYAVQDYLDDLDEATDAEVGQLQHEVRRVGRE